MKKQFILFLFILLFISCNKNSKYDIKKNLDCNYFKSERTKIIISYLTDRGLVLVIRKFMNGKIDTIYEFCDAIIFKDTMFIYIDIGINNLKYKIFKDYYNVQMCYIDYIDYKETILKIKREKLTLNASKYKAKDILKGYFEIEEKQVPNEKDDVVKYSGFFIINIVEVNEYAKRRRRINLE